MGLVFLFLYAPILLLIVFSFNAGDSSAVWKGFSLHWYQELFQNRLIMESVYITLLVSLLATLIATVAGTFAAIGLYSLGRRRREALMTVNNIPMMNADIVTGVSLCLFFVAFFQFWGRFAHWVNGVQSLFELPERLTLGMGTLLLAHIAFNIPYVILNVAPKLRQMDKNLIDAAQDLGCTWMQAFFKVMLPEIKSGIISGALIAFTMSIDDFVISYFTAGSSSSTLAMTIYGMTKRRITPEVNAVSTLLFVSVLVLLVISNLREVLQEKRPARHKKRFSPIMVPPRDSRPGQAAGGGGRGLRLCPYGLSAELRRHLPAGGQRLLLGRVYRHGPDRPVRGRNRYPGQLPDRREQRDAVLPAEKRRRGLRCDRALRLYDCPAD